jgi:hypothetical protein
MAQRSRSLVGCSSSGPSAGVAAVSRPADALTAQSALSMMHCVDSVPGAPVVISGYWTGPDVEDGCGSVEAMLQRIVWCLCLRLTRAIVSGIWRLPVSKHHLDHIYDGYILLLSELFFSLGLWVVLFAINYIAVFSVPKAKSLKSSHQSRKTKAIMKVLHRLFWLAQIRRVWH